MRATEGAGAPSCDRDGKRSQLPVAVSAQRAVMDTLRYVPSVVAPSLLGFALVPILTRVLTPAQYGIFVLVSAAVSGVGAITNGWLTSSVLRMYPGARDRGYAGRFLLVVVADGTLSVLISGLLLIGLTSVIHLGASIEASPTAIVAIVLVATALVGDTSCSILRSQLRASAYSLSMTVRALGRLVGCVVGALVVGDRVVGALLGWAAASALTSMVPALLARQPTTVPPDPDSARSYAFGMLSRSLIAYGLPLSAGLVLQIVLSDIDRFLLQALVGTRQVGVYAAAYQLASGCVGVAVSIPVGAALPLLMRAWDAPSGRKHTIELLPRLVQQYVFLTLPAAVAISVLARPLLLLVTSPAYEAGAATMIPVSLGAFFQGLAQYTTAGLLLVRRTRRLLLLLAAAVAVNIVANLLLIPVLGLLGAGVATTVAYLVFAGGGWVATRRWLPLRLPLRDFARLGLATATMAGVLIVVLHYVVRSTPVVISLAVSSGLVVYLAVAAALGELPWVPRWRWIPGR